MFKKILIANRGEIACRVIATARRLGIRTVAVHSDADAGARHVALADEAYRIGPPPVAESYLGIARLIEVCRASGAEAVHPGYGFLSENPDFVEAVEAAGLIFIGPPAAAIRAMGLKDAAKGLMEESGVPIVPGYHGVEQDPDLLAARAAEIGYPVMIKARAGGGGKGMRRVDDPAEFRLALEGANREALASFGDGHCLLEKYLTRPRHIEIQIFADHHGHAVHLFERDCSLQRRHQKVIEEAPAPGMPDAMRTAMGEAAVRAAEAIGYRGAGTVEFIADVSDGLRADRFYFMEMNTRLQVEHPVTEAITGLDLIEWQLRVAAGDPLPCAQDDLGIGGWAFEARIYAEDTARDFLPATGNLVFLSLPEDQARVDTGVRQGDEITPFYDPMIAKLIVHGTTRDVALTKLRAALADCRVAGAITNIDFLSALAAHEGFARGDVDTGLIDRDLDRLLARAAPTPAALGLAALEALGLLTPMRDPDPWQSLAGWRLWSEAPHVARLAWNGEPIEVRVVVLSKDRYRIETENGIVDLGLLSGEGGDLRCRIDDRTVGAGTVRHGAGITVFLDGRTYEVEIPDWLTDDDDSTTSGDHIVAPMPGLVKMVGAEVGRRVAKGDPLVVLEAMKMEHTLTAPRDGTVGEVLVAIGDQIEEAAILLSLDTTDD